MKNRIKLFGIIAVVAVIGLTLALSLTGCDDGYYGDGRDGDGYGGGYGSYPPANILAKYGLSGLNIPGSNFYWLQVFDTKYDGLSISFTSKSNTLSYLDNYFSRSGLSPFGGNSDTRMWGTGSTPGSDPGDRLVQYTAGGSSSLLMVLLYK